jgi:sorting nexin-8
LVDGLLDASICEFSVTTKTSVELTAFCHQPFRLLPTLPPKRIGPDQAFLEQRRKGLKRFINFVANHPILKDDGAVNVFLTQSGPFEAWRKRTRVNLDEESTQKVLDKASEMRIPSDLDTKLDLLRSSLPILVESYSKLVMIAEKAVKRMEAAAADQARMAMTLATLSEKQPMSCWRCADSETSNGIGGNACNLCKGVSRGLSVVGDTFTREAEDTDRRVSQSLSVRRI